MPIRDSLQQFESGNGYALRMVVENGMVYSDLTKALTSLGHRYLPNSAGRTIAFWFGADPAELSRAIPLSYSVNARQVTSFLGHQFMRPYHIRFTKPQLCVRCLEEYGIALAVWDFSLVTCCPKHKILLIDRCAKCQRIISWRRPDLWTCHCRAEFPLMSTETASTDAVWLSQQIEGLLFDSESASGGDESCRYLLSVFSLDVLLRVIRALGISEGEHAKDLLPGRLTRILGTTEAQLVVARAFLRMEAIVAGISLEQYARSLHLKELNILHGDASGQDEKTLMLLLNTVAGIDARCSSLKSTSQQLCLF